MSTNATTLDDLAKTVAILVADKAERAGGADDLAKTVAILVADKAERAGGAKTMKTVLMVFGGVFSTAIIGFFLWMVAMESSAQSQAMSIDQLAARHVEQTADGRRVAESVSRHGQSIAVMRHANEEMLRRLRLLEESNQDILIEIRRISPGGRRRQ